jgi:GT2 family glycosyltransferase
MGTISVIIVSWNAREHLRKCLNSIRQAGGPLVREIIVIDNASTDGSADIIAGQFPEVTLLRCNENLGFARANNLGLKRASGPLLALVNSDVVVHPGCFEALSAYLDSQEEVGLVGPKVFGEDGRVQPTCRRLPTLWNTACRALALDNARYYWRPFSGTEMRQWDGNTLMDVQALSGCFWLARRVAVEQVGGLDERFFFYAEDLDWCKRFGDAGWKVTYAPAATATHFGGGSSANAPLRYSIQMLRANLAYWRKHRGVFGQAAYYCLSVVHHSLRLAVRFLKTAVARGRSAGSDDDYKRHRSLVCLRWLLTGKGVPSDEECCKSV